MQLLLLLLQGTKTVQFFAVKPYKPEFVSTLFRIASSHRALPSAQAPAFCLYLKAKAFCILPENKLLGWISSNEIVCVCSCFHQNIYLILLSRGTRYRCLICMPLYLIVFDGRKKAGMFELDQSNHWMICRREGAERCAAIEGGFVSVCCP